MEGVFYQKSLGGSAAAIYRAAATFLRVITNYLRFCAMIKHEEEKKVKRFKQEKIKRRKK